MRNGVDIFRIVAPREGAALGRSEPGIGLAEGDFMAPKMIGEIGLDDAEYISRGNGALGNDGLV